MKQLFGTLALAFSMYSAIPMPRDCWSPENQRYAICAFPFVGAVSGGGLLLLAFADKYFNLPAPFLAAAATLMPLLVSGGIHLDGLCDTADALASHREREEKLAILKDPHIGAFGVITCCGYFLAMFALWSCFSWDIRVTAVLALCQPLVRLCSACSVVSFPMARADSSLGGFAEDEAKKNIKVVLFVLTIAVSAAMLIISPIYAALSLGTAALVLFICYRMNIRQFGGITGDLAGFFLQICEGAVLLSCVLLEVIL